MSENSFLLIQIAMHKRILLATLATLFTGLTAVQAQEKITYTDQVRPLLENKCFSCHNPDKKKGDLDLTSFASAMVGGGGGSIVSSGDPESSKLISTTTKKTEPFMPPEGAPLSPAEIEILSKWIHGGLLDTATSLAKKSQPRANLTLAVTATGKPEGPLPTPENVLLEPVVVTARTNAVTALAASPWSPLVAVSGIKQALIYDANTKVLAGVYPYPEGYIRSLKFSRNGALLIAGGGRGGKFGNAVVWDVKTGKRITEVGREFDSVLSADITANQSMIAIGSPSKKVKCFNTSTGEELYVIKKHTEWVLSVAFSPDGVLLASGDRNGGVIVSEAKNGGEFYLMDTHKKACTGLAWRSDSNILASCGEDGKIFTYEMENGKVVKTWDAHGVGCSSIAFTPDGNIVSTGRDNIVRTWDINGKKLTESKGQPNLLTNVVALYDNKTVVSGDFEGVAKLWSIDKFDDLGEISTNPAPIAQRIVESERKAAELVAQVPANDAEIKKASDAVTAQEVVLADARKKAADAEAKRQLLDAEIKNIPAKIVESDAAVKAAQAKREAQAQVLKTYEQTIAQIKQVEPVLAALIVEKAKLTAPEQAASLVEVDKKIAEQTVQIDTLKKASAAVPAPLADFDKIVTDSQAALTALNASKPIKTVELENTVKAIATFPKTITDLEQQIGGLKVVQTAAQNKLNALRTQIAVYEKLPTLLRAAQFNVSVLSEKEKLEKLEVDIVSYKETLKDAEAVKIDITKNVEASKIAIAETNTALPALEALAAKHLAELPPVEKTIEPGTAEDAQISALIVTHKQNITNKEAEIKAAEQEKINRIATGKKAEEEINKQMVVLQAQLVDVNAKLDAPAKVEIAKKAEFDKANADLESVKKQQEVATQVNQDKINDGTAKENAFNVVHLAVDVMAKSLTALQQQQLQVTNEVNVQKTALQQKEAELAAATKDNKADVLPTLQKATEDLKVVVAAVEKKAGEVTAQVTAADLALVAKKTEEGVAKAAHDVAQKAKADALAALNAVIAQVPVVQNVFNVAKAQFDQAVKAAAPLHAQQQALTVQIETQKKALAEKQAEPVNADKEFVVKSQAALAIITQTKAALDPIEKQLLDVRIKLAEVVKVIELKRAEVGKAKSDVASAKAKLVKAQKTIDIAPKETADKDKLIAEINAEIVKQEPLLQPLRDKVKAISEQYLAMLPK